MNCFLLSSLVSLCSLLLLALSAQSVSSQNVSESYKHQASYPPRGWNSYDSFSWTVSEEEFLQNAEIVSQRLQAHGYKYVVVDYLWYRKKVQGAFADSYGFDVIDEWGRVIPDPGRWPSSRGGKGFSEVAKKVHSMGLKFGIHVMRGISTQAFNANTPILDTTKGGAYQESGRVWHAKDAASPERPCAWMPHGFMSVDTKLGAGRAFLRSLYEQYASWGVDFVKHDCVFGADFDLSEISYVSEVLRELNHPIVYSLSPGSSATTAIAKDVSGLVNMYRVTGDDWDIWGDVKFHFDVSSDFSLAGLIGAKGLKGNSWPDLDMLPFGWLTDPGANEGPHRFSKLTPEEQRTQMTLWSMAKSPLMYGGDLRKIDPATYDLITNPILLEINSFSSSNREFPYISSSENLNHKDHHLRVKKRRSKRGRKPSYTHALRLASCSETKAIGWSVESLNEDLEKICWKASLENQLQAPFCVHKRGFQFTLDGGESRHQEGYEGKHHLVAINNMKFCLDASPKQKLTSKEFKRGSFSPCTLDANQMWKLNPNGTMVNSYSGLCAIAESVKDDINPGGSRSWIAKGRRGELYVAFFNLNEEKTVISTKASYLGSALAGRSISSCKGKEVWSGKQVITAQGTLSAQVESHGSALFILSCK